MITQMRKKMKEEQEPKVPPISLKRLKLRIRSPLNPLQVITQESSRKYENLASQYMKFRALALSFCCLGCSPIYRLFFSQTIYRLQTAFNLP